VTKRWKQRPPGSNWGDYGDDDELGQVNLLTKEKVLQGIAEVKEGLTFSLSLPLNLPVEQFQRRYAPVLKPTEDLAKNQDVFYNIRMSEMMGGDLGFKDIWSDDHVHMWSQYSTQWDAFCHVGYEFDADGDGTDELCYYNGFQGHIDVIGPADDAMGDGSGSTANARRVGVEPMALHGMQGRGVLIDFEKHFGREFRGIDLATLQDVMKQDGVVVEPGDMLLLHTGYATQILEWGLNPDKDKYLTTCTYLDAQDQALLDWITESKITALVADNHSVEGLVTGEAPKITHTLLPIHHLCLFLIGVPLGELWYLNDLAMWLREHNRSRFLLTAPPLRLPAAGSALTPIATV
jgi:hypothetical protein